LLSNASNYQEPEKMIKLWIHEVERTYGDRLVSVEHLKAMREILNDIVKKTFTAKMNFQKYFAKENPEPLIYANFT
jgi:dynein heavy chain